MKRKSIPIAPRRVRLFGASGLFSLGLVALLCAALAYWKASGSDEDWLADHGADLIAAFSGAVAFIFVAIAALQQVHQSRQSELLTTFELLKPDLEGLSMRIALNGRIVGNSNEDFKAAAERYKRDFLVDRTAFVRVFARGDRLKRALAGKAGLGPDTLRALERQTRLYVRLFEQLLRMCPNRQAQLMLLDMPLGRGYAAIKVAMGHDRTGFFREHIDRVHRGVGSEDDLDDD
jgi:hypothetical protein